MRKQAAMKPALLLIFVLATTVVTAAPSSKEYRVRGTREMALGQNQEALADLTRAIELEPRRSDNYMVRALIYRKLAEKEVDLFSPPEVRARGEVHFQKALVDANRYCRMEPKDTRGYCIRGEIYGHYAVRDPKTYYPKALADFNKSIALKPNAIAYVGRARMEMRLGQQSAADADLEQAKKLIGPSKKR